MIPKVIHWCWFGRGKYSPLVKKCIDSWRKFLPDYEIKLWNEDNFDVHCNKYVEEAYQNKKWAFVTDYVRLYALYHEGGIYMDSDVEVIKSLDCFLGLPAFSGRDSVNGSLTGTMGSMKGGQWVKDLLEDYGCRHFINEDGSFNLTTNVAYTDELMLKYGLKFEDEEFEVPNYVKLFKQEVFCPKSFRDRSYNITKNTYTIHHFSTTWHPLRIRVLNQIRDKFGYIPCRIVAILWTRPDVLVKKVWGRLFK